MKNATQTGSDKRNDGKHEPDDVEISPSNQMVRSVREVMESIEKEKKIEEEIQEAVVKKLQCGKKLTIL